MASMPLQAALQGGSAEGWGARGEGALKQSASAYTMQQHLQLSFDYTQNRNAIPCSNAYPIQVYPPPSMDPPIPTQTVNPEMYCRPTPDTPQGYPRPSPSTHPRPESAFLRPTLYPPQGLTRAHLTPDPSPPQAHPRPTPSLSQPHFRPPQTHLGTPPPPPLPPRVPRP